MTVRPPAVSTVTVQGLRKIVPPEGESPEELHAVQVEVEESARISAIWDEINKLGYEVPDLITKGEKSYTRIARKTILNSHEAVTVVADDQPSTKGQIRLNEMFITHANEHYGEPLEFNVENKEYDNPKRPTKCLREKSGLNITFQRTPRMPDDNRLHQLPGTLGMYELYNVEAYADRLPENIRKVGGVFFPMWQREAMWINFNMKVSQSAPKWAVRVFVGRINAISGLPMDQKPVQDDGSAKQDYVVLPGQRWLDGICVAPGVVRQFVAMPLGSGYTIEGQKTSEEKYGGLQIEVIPEFKRGLRDWVRPLPESTKPDTINMLELPKKCIDEWRTPEKEGLKVGDIMLCFVNPMVRSGWVLVQDLVNGEGDGSLTAYYEYPQSTIRYVEFTKSGSFGYTAESSRGRESYSGRDGLLNAPIRKSAREYVVVEERSFKGPLEFKRGKPRGPSGSPIVPSRENALFSSNRSQQPPPTKPPTTVDIPTKDLRAMGLAAGGKLVQDIHKDPYPPQTWNRAFARTIHIHILDPVSCEQVTNMVPVPPSMDAKTYAEAGGQFYVVEEKVNARLDGGEFDGIKSVAEMDKEVGVVGGKEPEFDPLRPTKCVGCGLRLCDCIIRQCDHPFCNVCINEMMEQSAAGGADDAALARQKWKCPRCDTSVERVAWFSAPMNLPGEKPLRMKVPVHVLQIEDGRVEFRSVQETRI